MKRILSRLLMLAIVLNAAQVAADNGRDQQLLKRLHAARVQLEQERQRQENEARNNAPLIRSQPGAGETAPSVRQMRRDMAVTLARYEQNFRCLDVDVDNQGGNTVVICGSNSGDISGENVSAGQDLHYGGSDR